MDTRIGRSVTKWPTGLTVYDRERCAPGYTLFAPFQSPIVYLLDMNGEVVHLWFISMGPSARTTVHAKYVGDGRLLYQMHQGNLVQQQPGTADRPVSSMAWLYEVDWHGTTVWSYAPTGTPDDPHNARETVGWDSRYQPYGTHHDFQRLPNGNTLLLCGEKVTNPDISDHELQSDYYIEVTLDGRVVWSWHSDQHFDEFGFGEETRRLIREAPGIHPGLGIGDYLHMNTVEVLPSNDLAARDSRFHPGNILGCQRNTNTIFIIDKPTGRVVWTWGRDELVGPHHPNMLPNGNIIVYDNGGLAGYPRRARAFTRLVELDPISGKVVWSYFDDRLRYNHQQLFGYFWGSIQRLANGNTLSLDTMRGRLFEVTTHGDIVWEYVNGFMGMFDFQGMKRMETGVYRCYRIPYEAVPDFSADFQRYQSFESTWIQQPSIM